MKGKLTASMSYDAIVIDGMNLAISSHVAGRSFSYNGKPTGCLYLSLRRVLSLQHSYPHARVIVMWEGGSPRDLLLPVYKAQRPKKDNELAQAVSTTQKAFSLMGLTQMAHIGAEADDLAQWYIQKNPEKHILLVSTDHDWYQFLSPKVDVMMKSNVYTWMELRHNLGFPPERIGIVKILTGDPSDNVKGLPRFPTALARSIAAACSTYEEIPEYPFSEKQQRWKQLILDMWPKVVVNAKVLLAHAEWIRDEAVVITPPERTAQEQAVCDNELRTMLDHYGIRSLRF